MVITSDTTIAGRSLLVRGDVIVRGGATLTLLGTSLRIGGHVDVDRNASLELGPHQGAPTSLRALNESQGFWVSVNGTIRSGGVPQTVIWGLRGDGLETALFGNGGIQIFGAGELRDVHVENGTAGLTVRRDGVLKVTDSTVSNVGFIGIAALGKLELDNATVIHNAMGVSGHKTCDIAIRDSFIFSKGDNVLVNSCKVSVTTSMLRGGGASLTVNGNVPLNLTDTWILDYHMSGVSALPLPSETGPAMLQPSVRIDNVSLTPGVKGKWGLELNSAISVVRRLSTSGHERYGVDVQGGSLEIYDSSITGNAWEGLRVREARLIQAGNYFGTLAEGNLNGKGSISNVVVFDAQAVALNGSAIPGLTVEIFRPGSAEPIFSKTDNETGRFEVSFESYATDSDGSPRYLGPFTFRASHPLRKVPMTGDVVESDADLYMDIDPEARESSFGGWILFGIFAIFVSLLVYGFAAHPLERLWKSSRRRFRAR